MSHRLNVQELFPDAHRVLMQLSKLVAESGIDIKHQELIKIRASQINGCAFCLNKHSSDAIKYGEDPKRLYVLSAWREAKEWFSEPEQVILRMTEEVTLIANHGLSDATYRDAVTLFGEEMTAKIIVAIININALNRMAVSTSKHPF